MKFKSILLLAVALTACNNVDKIDENETTPETIVAKKIKLTQKQSDIVNSYNNTSLDLFKEIKNSFGEEGDSDGEVVLSPASLLQLLGMYANATAGETSAQILNFLNIADILQLNELCGKLKDLDDLDASSISFSQNNSAWFNTGCTPSESFISSLTDVFNCEFFEHNLESLDFEHDYYAWISKTTNGLLTESFLSPRTLSDLSLANTIYFKGEWANRFDANQTRNAIFTNIDGNPVGKDFMIKTFSVKYTDIENYNTVSLDYGHGAFSMLITDAPEVDNNLLSKFDDNLSLCNITLWLPKFKIATLYSGMNEILRNKGISNLFDESKADFTASGLKIKDGVNMYHQAAISVDESGATAVAVSGDGMYTSPGPAAIVKYDKPFTFIIRENSTGMIVFMGRKQY